MSRTIYIVSGSTGEYSDRCDWLVDAHTTEQAAKDRITQLDALMQETGVLAFPYADWKEKMDRIDAMKTHLNGDPFFSCDYTGTSYSYAECELKDAP